MIDIADLKTYPDSFQPIGPTILWSILDDLQMAKGFLVRLSEATMVEGVHHWLIDRQASASKHWQRSLALAEEMGARCNVGITSLEMGRRLNDREHFQKAEAIFAEIGAEWDLEQASRYLQLSVERKES